MAEAQPPEVRWTRQQVNNTLQAVEIVRAGTSSTNPDQNVRAALFAILNIVPADYGSAEFAEAAPDIIAGLMNVATALAEHSAQRSNLTVQKVLDDVAEAVRTGVTVID